MKPVRGSVGSSTMTGETSRGHAEAARRADAVVVVAGLTYREEGEYLSSLSRVGR